MNLSLSTVTYYTTILVLVWISNLEFSYTQITQCNTVYTRKELRQLTTEEFSRFVSALKRLNSNSRINTPTEYDKFSNIHSTYSVYNHGYAPFLTWHRAFLIEFERKLQQIDNRVVLPYWDWSIDSQAPENSFVFTNRYFGGNGNTKNSNCVNTGQFRNWTVYYTNNNNNGQRKCLSRRFDSSNRISAFYSPEALNYLISSSTSYNVFRQSIELSPHARVHNGIGGDMMYMNSPNDPLFYMHHAFIDKLYAKWQSTHSDKAYDYSGLTNTRVNVQTTDRLSPFQYSPNDMFETTKLCYRYDDVIPFELNSNNNEVSNNDETSDSINNDENQTLDRNNIDFSNNSDGFRNNVRNGINRFINNNNWFRSRFWKRSISNSTAYQTNNNTTEDNNSNNSAYEDIEEEDDDCTYSDTEQLSMNNESNQTYPDALDRTNLKHLRVPMPIPLVYIRLNQYNTTIVRAIEHRLQNVVVYYNKMDNYSSIASLKNRPELLKNTTTIYKSNESQSEQSNNDNEDCDNQPLNINDNLIANNNTIIKNYQPQPSITTNNSNKYISTSAPLFPSNSKTGNLIPTIVPSNNNNQEECTIKTVFVTVTKY